METTDFDVPFEDKTPCRILSGSPMIQPPDKDDIAQHAGMAFLQETQNHAPNVQPLTETSLAGEEPASLLEVCLPGIETPDAQGSSKVGSSTSPPETSSSMHSLGQLRPKISLIAEGTRVEARGWA